LGKFCAALLLLKLKEAAVTKAGAALLLFFKNPTGIT
jgi:hypothetical protein